MWCKCKTCEKEFDITDEGYIGPYDLGDVECHPFMEMAEWCDSCHEAEIIKQGVKKDGN